MQIYFFFVTKTSPIILYTTIIVIIMNIHCKNPVMNKGSRQSVTPFPFYFSTGVILSSSLRLITSYSTNSFQ